MFREVRFWDTRVLPQVSLTRSSEHVSLIENEQEECVLCRGLVGAGLGFGLHEGGHLLTNAFFQSDPYLKPVKGGGIPFFSISIARFFRRGRKPSSRHRGCGRNLRWLRLF